MFEMLTTPSLQQATWKERLHGPRPKPCNLFFSNDWPSAQKWAKGKFWRITQTALVPFDKGYILPGGDWKNIDLSNATNGLALYPANDGVVYEALIGLKPGNYQVGLYIPGESNYMLALGDSAMYPDLNDATKRYLGKMEPPDTPYENALLKLWFLKDMAAWIVKIYVQPGVDFEKCVLGFRIAKHMVEELTKAPDVFTTIPFYDEFRGTW